MPVYQYVSIHAPTQGATRTAFDGLDVAASFNPRAHAGRDNFAFKVALAIFRFQSTRPRRARHRMQGQRPQAAPVSIHAPTQGATCFQLRNLRFNSCFNPRAHAGRDTKKPLPAARTGKFQSTRPRRARQWQMNAPNTVNKVSIHAPTQGATLKV